MKTILAFVGAAGIAALFWFLRGSSDSAVLAAKDAQIAAIQETIKAKDNLANQESRLIDARDTSNKELQDKLNSAKDTLTKNQAQLDADKVAYQKLHDADETIIHSLKGDNNAEIQSLKEQLQFKDEQIAQLNEKLVQTIASYEAQLKALRSEVTSAPMPALDDGEKIYPKDDGFDAQSLGTGMFAYQVFSQLNNPTNAPQPPPIPNASPWTFGGTGNSGISANEAFYVTNAKNGDHDGKSSQAGQAAFLQFKGSWFSQKIKLPAGTYSISFDYEARRDYGEADGIAVSLDGSDLYVGAPTDATNFSHVKTQTVTIRAAGEYELKFRGLGAMSDPDGDHTTFIDNVYINVVDSPKHSPKKVAAETPAR